MNGKGDKRGRLIVLLGPDGSGKTTVAEALSALLRDSGTPTERLYMGAGTPGLPTRRLRQAMRRRRSSRPGSPSTPPLDAGRRHRLVEVVHVWADFRWRGRSQIRPLLADGVTVVCDRYAYDLATWNVPRLSGGRLVALLRRSVRRPDITIFLSAPAEIIHARRDELTVAEIERQQRRLELLVDRLPGAVTLDASRSPDEIARAAAALLKPA
jgi:thymidylate kinase